MRARLASPLRDAGRGQEPRWQIAAAIPRSRRAPSFGFRRGEMRQGSNAMRWQRFDAVARGLAAVSRRRSFAVAVAGLAPLAPRLAGARAGGKRNRRRCRRQAAVVVSGQCRCAWIGNGEQGAFACQDDPACLCVLTAEGSGYCTRPPLPSNGGCHQSADCPPAAACILTNNGPPVCVGPCHPAV